MKLIKLLINVVTCLFLLIFINDASAQCISVKKVNGTELRISIPCDFPIKTSETNSFNDDINTWYKNNPSLKDVVLTPKSHPSNDFIEIPILIYDQFSDSKKKAVNGLSYFYKRIQNN